MDIYIFYFSVCLMALSEANFVKQVKKKPNFIRPVAFQLQLRSKPVLGY